ncbi:MAG: cysteine desulfuration protein SufE [Verrucomicrobiales bacterium]|jgi:cysteine desulfuration protein SufE
MAYPLALTEIIDFFESLSTEAERREALIAYAEGAAQHMPIENEVYAVEDVRKDEGCLDSVGIFLTNDENVKIRIELGDKVQTLTRALTTILCKSFSRSSLNEIANIDSSFVPRIVGAELMRQRSQTVYYVLERLREAATQLLATSLPEIIDP